MVQHGAERVMRVVTHDRVFYRFADGDAKRTGTVGMLGQDRAAGGRVHARAGYDARAVSFHEDASIRLLVVARPNHVDLDLNTKHGAGRRQGTAPLPGAGFGRDSLDALFLVVEGLGDGGVRFVAAGRAEAFVLVVDVGRSVEQLLESSSADQRTRSEERVGVANGAGNLDLALGGDFLHDQGHGEERGEVGRAERLVSSRVQRRHLRNRQIGRDVVPGARDLVLVQHETGALDHATPPAGMPAT